MQAMVSRLYLVMRNGSVDILPSVRNATSSIPLLGTFVLELVLFRQYYANYCIIKWNILDETENQYFQYSF
jgi:hypothetical protein